MKEMQNSLRLLKNNKLLSKFQSELNPANQGSDDTVKQKDTPLEIFETEAPEPMKLIQQVSPEK